MMHIDLASWAQLASLAEFSTTKEVVVQDVLFFFSFSEVLGASTWNTKV
jgi:hypothetical protein